MSDIEHDEIGRTFCKLHHRETCHECCMCFEPMNREAEERAGLVQERTEAEKLAEEKAQALYALRGMEQMVPRPNEEIVAQTRKWYDDTDAKLQKLRDENKKEATGEDIDAAWRKAVEREERREMEQRAMMQAWSSQNPGKNTWEFGGAETQKIFEKFAATPDYGKNRRVDLHTCGYCHKVSVEELKFCAKCKKVVYCNRECQKKAWKAHKKVCVPADSGKVKSARLTWDQLEALQGEPAIGQTLEVRAILDESVMRQVIQCKDRNGVMRRVAAYTNSRIIPGLKPGSVLKWKNPRFHYFMDGSSGARIEESDLVNVSVSDK